MWERLGSYSLYISWVSQGGRMPALSRNHLMQPLMVSSFFCTDVSSFRCVFLLYICKVLHSPGTNGLKIRIILPLPHSPPKEVESSMPHPLPSSMPLGCSNSDSALFSSTWSRSSGFSRQPKDLETCPVRARAWGCLSSDICCALAALHHPSLSPSPAEQVEELLLMGRAGH